MSKRALKKQLGAVGDPSLVDIDRIVQKVEGGQQRVMQVKIPIISERYERR